MSDQTPPPSEEPESVPTPEPVVYTPASDQPVAYTPAPPVAVPTTGNSNGMGVTALIFGIAQFFCIPFIGGILAIVFGRIGINKAKRGEATNGGMAKAGFWLGIVGLVLSVIGGVVATIAIVVAISVLNTNTSADVNSKTGMADGEYAIQHVDANYSLNDRCGFTGDAIDVSGAVIKEGVTVSGSGLTQCSAFPMGVIGVRFDVVNGVADILEVA
ncbi:MAG: DUF4190 domain-containing protein [Actinomycetota bacterium]|nr:DUF4190 domain-containing protein [Actinomycetota bacterium]